MNGTVTDCGITRLLLEILVPLRQLYCYLPAEKQLICFETTLHFNNSLHCRELEGNRSYKVARGAMVILAKLVEYFFLVWSVSIGKSVDCTRATAVRRYLFSVVVSRPVWDNTGKFCSLYSESGALEVWETNYWKINQVVPIWGHEQVGHCNWENHREEWDV